MLRKDAITLLIAGSSAPALTAVLPSPAGAAELDNRYVKALQTVDDFLTAWRHRDPAGSAFLTASANKKYGSETVRGFLVGTSSPSNAAYEILEGKTLSPTHYRFSVKLYFFITGGGLKVPTAQSIDVKSGNDVDWMVDSLPA